MKSEDKLVSIVVPVYNVSEYIHRCVDSILSQDYEKIELVLVDDGSPGDCPAICDEYAQSDARVRVIHKKNGGLSDARNTGLRAAQGEYVAFVDGDDYIASNFISVLLTNAVEQGADISVCNYSKVFDNYSKIISRKKLKQRAYFTNLEAMRDIFSTSSLCEVMTWNKLYKRSIFIENGILFPVGKIHEDNFTTYKLFFYSEKVVYTSESLYYYLQRSESIMGRGFSNKSLDMLEAASLAVEWVEDHHLPLKNEVEAYQFSTNINLLNTMVDGDGVDIEVLSSVRSLILKSSKVLLKSDYVSGKQKFLLRILRLGTGPYAVVRKLYVRLLNEGVVR